MTRPSPRLWISFASLLLLSPLVSFVSSCADPISFDRNAPDRGTFGQELFSIFYEDLTRAPAPGPDKARAFDAHRDGFVWAIDALLPPDRLTALEGLLQRAFPDITSGLLPGFTRKVAAALDAVAADAPLLAELSAPPPDPPPFLADPDRLDLFTLALDLPRVPALLDLTLSFALSNDGRGDHPDLLPKLLHRLYDALSTAEVSAPDPDGFLSVVTRVALLDDPIFQALPNAAPLRAVALDPRGLPRVRRNDIGSLPSPFVDRDGDALPDAAPHPNGLLWFIDGDGAPLPPDLLAPFGDPDATLSDGLRRAPDGTLTARGFDGDAVYEYIDLRHTPLSFLLHESLPLLRDDVLFDLFDALKPVLGPRAPLPADPTAPKTPADLVFEAYADQNQLIGLADALLIALDHDATPALLAGAEALLRDHPDQLATLLDALTKAADTFDLHPTDFAADAAILEALLPILRDVLDTPGLLEDILIALDHPTMRAIPGAVSQLMSYEAGFISIAPDSPYELCYLDCKRLYTIGTMDRMQCIQDCPNDEIFQTPVTSPSQRSLFERTLAIIWEAAGQPYDVGFTEFEFGSLQLINVTDAMGPAMKIDNMAKTYLRALVGDLALTDVLNPQLAELAQPLGVDDASMTGVMLWVCQEILSLDMDANPDPGQLTRLFNKRPLGFHDDTSAIAMNLPVCRSGRLCIDAHADALYAAEASGLLYALYPLASAFQAHDRLDILVELFSVLYAHYPSADTLDLDLDGQPIAGISPDNLRSLEPALNAILSEQDLLKLAADLAVTARTIDLDFATDRSRFIAALEATLRFVITPDPTLRLITGEDSLLDPSQKPISPLRPFDVLLDPLDKLSAQVDADPVASAAWDRAIDRLIDLILAREPGDAPNTSKFSNPAGLRVATIVLSELRAHWLSIDAQGLRTQSLRVDYPQSLKDAFRSPWLPLVIDTLSWFDAQPGARDDLRAVLLHIMQDAQQDPEQVLLLAYDLLPTLLDGRRVVTLLNLVAPYLDPTRTWPTTLPSDDRPLWLHAIDLLDSLQAKDPDDLTVTLLLDALKLRGPQDHSPGWWLGQTISETHRLQPGEGTDLAPADVTFMLNELSAYLRDEQRGLERAIDLVGFVLDNGGGPPGQQQPTPASP
jgi:hypothetical protein